MDKRNFLRAITGAAAAVGVPTVVADEREQLKPLPSEPMFTYRTAGPWGEGNGVHHLVPVQVDENFWRIEQLIRKLYAAQSGENRMMG